MQDLTEIANFATQAEAETAAAILKNEGIPYIIQSQEGMLHGPFFPGATIYVNPEDADRAADLLGISDEGEA